MTTEAKCMTAWAILAVVAFVLLTSCVYVPKPDDSWLGEAYNHVKENP